MFFELVKLVMVFYLNIKLYYFYDKNQIASFNFNLRFNLLVNYTHGCKKQEISYHCWLFLGSMQCG